jgi:molecular chaperone DnaJ
MGKSYFAILGITSDATQKEVRSAYRRLSKEFHPDHYNGGSRVFQEIQEAYSVLGDVQRRMQYERSLKQASARTPKMRAYRQGPEPLIPENRPVDIGEISPVRSFERFTPSFDEVFDWLWSNFSSLAPSKSGRIQQLTIEVPISAEQAYCGGNARVMVPARAICPMCHGYGEIGIFSCSRCAGEGEITGEIPVSISFPPGLTKDHAVMVPLDRFGIRNLALTVLFRCTDLP